MTIQVERRADGLIAITCGGEQILIDPFSVSPQSPSPVIITPPPQKTRGPGSPPPVPTVMFCIADRFQLGDPSRVSVLAPDIRPTVRQVLSRKEVAIATTIDLELRGPMKFPLATLTDTVGSSVGNRDVNIRVWVPRGEGRE